MIKRKISNIRKCKNPSDNILFLETNFPDIEFTIFGNGKDSEVYKFSIKKNIIVDNILLKPGKYVMKLPHEYIEFYDVKYLNKVDLFSKYGLIPKIYAYNKNFVIMKFIEGDNLRSIFNSFTRQEKIDIVNDIEKIIKIYHKLKFVHGDLTIGNVLITPSKKLYIIDPDPLIIDGFEEYVGPDSDYDALDYIRKKYGLLSK
jgi:predicted Ser/Thr protein kinase